MKETGPLHKNIHFNIGVIFTVIEGFLSGCSYIMIYLVIQILLGKKTTTTDILTITGILCVIYVLRVLIYSIGYTQNQIGGAAVSKNLRLFLGDKFKRIPLFRFTHGQVGQYVNTMTCDVNGYEQILTHKVSNLTKNIALAVMVIVFICYLYLPAGGILLLSTSMLIPEMWLSFRTVKKYGTRKNKVSSETVSSIVEYIEGIQTFRAYGVAGTKIRQPQKQCNCSVRSALNMKRMVFP